MNQFGNAVARSESQILSTNKLIKNTYILLSMTLLFSAGIAGVAMVMNVPPLGFLVTLVGYIGLLFLTAKLRNSVWGLVSVFAFTGFMGLTLGPIINLYLNTFANGDQLVMTAMGGTGIIFLSLSGYALTTRKDFSFMGGFLLTGIMVMLGAVILSMFVNIPGLQLAISAVVVLLMSGFILYDTSRMVNGGETNYIMATVSLYINIYMLFTHLLHLLGAFAGED